ncbi:MAG: hypothetical protein Q4G03_06885 [Planctomycetia bacterium]|nr:hypothetical protein [Planctomycetia bacterium]
MRKRLFMILPVAVIALTSMLGASTVQAAESDVSVETYKLSDGTNCFLIPLQADVVDSTSDYVDVAALIDFSASQVGLETRNTTQETVDALIASLPKNARVQLFAVSNETEPLTDGFLPVNSTELRDVVASLKTRDTLGAADLENSFNTALDAFDYNESADRSIVFIGRGVSTSAAFNEEVFEETVAKLVDARVPVNSYGVGAVVDMEMLGALANRTGGYVVEESVDAKTAGKELASATTATVFYPEENSLDLAGASVYPSPLPPIRSDRETYLVGSSDAELTETSLKIPAMVADGREADIEWNLVPKQADKGNQYIAQLVQNASVNDGATLAIAGRDMLTDQQVALNDVVDVTLDLIDEAVEDGDVQAAQRLARSINDNAKYADAEDSLQQDDSDADPFAKTRERYSLATTPDKTDSFLEAGRDNKAVKTKSIQTQCQVIASNARKAARTDPEGALEQLKLTINAVKNQADLDPADREVLLHDLYATAQFVENERESYALRELTAQRNLATAESVRKAQSVYQQNQTKVVEIMKRFSALIEESKFVLAAQAAKEAAKISPDNALPTQAANVALLRDAYEENQFLRYERRKRLLDVLMSVERAHIPVSDEPPITYPEAEVWANLTKERKEKYGTTNLTGSEEEQRIAKILDSEKVNVDGGEDSDLTLSSWIEDVKAQLRKDGKDFNVVFDVTNIEEAAGAPSSLDVNENLSNITLRKALKIVLRPHELAFCILDDSLFITTQDEIKNNPDISTSIQLYSVGDLIMQPNQGSMNGGMGGYGNNGNNRGGGMGGFGGGNRGGFGGGGNWAVPSTRNAVRNPNGQRANDAILQNFLEAPAAADPGLFAVPSRSKKTAAAAPKPTTENAGSLAQGSVDLKSKWNSWFVANAPVEKKDANESEQAAYQAARDKFAGSLPVEVAKLMQAKQYDSAAAFIKAAMRNGYADGWMYEALAAALIAANAPQKEVEQAILSVVDFNGDPIVLMGLAAYLEKVGSQARALKIYRDVARVYPTRPEPYVRGLELALELQDEDAQKWVALGIASLVWDGALVEAVEQAGEDLANDLIEKMRNDGREEEALAFEAELAKARERDVVVEVSWSGTAEIDLAVQEPTGAVCWFAQKRTAAGGTLSDVSVNLSKSYDANRQGLRTRVYSCPMGYSGDYHFLVSKSWGDLAQNKVTVSIRTNLGTEQEQSYSETLELVNDEAAFAVQLAQGRRSEEVKEELLTASAMINRLQIRNSRELAQRAKAAESRVAKNEAINSSKVQTKAQEYQSSYKATADAVADADMPQISYVTPDPGHMPIIDYLDLGAGFYTSAGISGDRRYVLVAPEPEFSQLLYMFTYNSADGSSGSSNGGNNNNNNRPTITVTIPPRTITTITEAVTTIGNLGYDCLS